VVLDQVHRFGGGIARLAGAIRAGDGDAVMELLRAGADDVVWLDGDVAEQDALPDVSRPALAAARATIAAARAGRARDALDALGSFRILCAHRRGPYGVATWTSRMEGWLAAELTELDPEDRWYIGRPLLVNENDYELRLNNGDTGVVVSLGDGRIGAAFARGEETIEHSPSRLGAVDTVYAMTVHKSQGSQFASAAVLLPAPDSRILTRELLYTAATRAQRRLILAGTEESVRAAVDRPVARASGLGRRLWGDLAA
jgi:exodeoxyribonuclease V alpha subunit